MVTLEAAPAVISPGGVIILVRQVTHPGGVIQYSAMPSEPEPVVVVVVGQENSVVMHQDLLKLPVEEVVEEVAGPLAVLEVHQYLEAPGQQVPRKHSMLYQ